MHNSDYSRLQDLEEALAENRKYKVSNWMTWTLIAIALVCVSLMFASSQVEEHSLASYILKICTEFSVSAFTVVLAIFVFDFFKNEKEKQTHESYIVELIWRTLQAKENKFISDLYKEEALDNVVKNCFNQYCKKLTDSNFEYIKSNLRSFRSGFKYKVQVRDSKSAATAGKGQLYPVWQDVSYRRFFRAQDMNAEYYFKVKFSFGERNLEKDLQAKNYFFREAIIRNETIEEVKKNAHDIDRVMAMLNYEMYLTDLNRPVSHDRIHMDVDDTGVTFTVNIPPSEIEILDPRSFEKKKTSHDFTDCYISYSARIKCEFELENHFYAIFAEPSISPYFRISFDYTAINHEDIRYITCLSFPNKNIENNGLSAEPDNNTIELRLPDDCTVFPKSGIYFMW